MRAIRLHRGPGSARPRRSRPRGFTLIETLIVVTIIGIIAVISATALRLLIPRWNLQDAGNQLDTLIKRSKLIAVQRQIPIEIRFENDAGATVLQAGMTRGTVYTLVAVDLSTAPPATVAKLPLYALSSGVEVDANTFGGERIRFDIFGQAESTGEITFGYDLDATQRRILTVSIDTLDGQTNIKETTI